MALKKIIMGILVILITAIIAIFFFMNSARFGKLPHEGNISQSPNFKDGAFRNLVDTPQMTGDKGTVAIFYDFLFKKTPNDAPKAILPSIKTDILNLKDDENVFIWLGHSSFFLKLGDKNFLIDPVLSDSAAPIGVFNPAFKGTTIYSLADFPKIDYLIISHDHWDHLDYPTIMGLKDKVDKIIMPIGVDAHFERWGIDKNKIHALDWDDQLTINDDLEIHCLTARHFSGRGLKRNQSLWASFLIKNGDYKFYYSGDSGYGPHFEAIGTKFDGVDLAVMEDGQYNDNWKFIHMSPEEAAQGGVDLKAKRVIPVHNSRFVLSKHTWQEPLERISAVKLPDNVSLITPKIGEKVDLKNTSQTFEKWWQTLD